MTPALSSLDDLRALLSADCVGVREDKAIASPQTTEEVAAIARFANRHNFSVEIIAGGTKRGWGNPVHALLFLDTTRLCGVREHSWHDLTATVAAGTPWAVMQRSLAAHNQQVALDPMWPETATVGGIVATNDSGSWRLKYGSLRDLIIGMTIVLADGTIAKSGGKVVKNVAGYDLHKLMTGAFGTLGVITEVTFRLHPIPAHTATWTTSSTTARPVGKLMMKVLDSQLSLQAMQLRANAHGYALDVELATLPEVLRLQMEALEELTRRLTTDHGVFVDAPELRRPNPFAGRADLFTPAGGVVLKATMLPSVMATLSADVVRLGGCAVTQATGIMLARFSEDAAAEALPSLRASIDAARDGSLTLLRAPQHPLPSWAIPPSGTEKIPTLMREIKRRFDPQRTLNPGRFVGGI